MSGPRAFLLPIVGLLLGFAAGLLFSWGVSPVRYVDASPASLRADFKDQYRGLIAAAFQVDGDRGRAAVRLALLGDADPAGALAAQAQRSLAEGVPEAQARALANLAASLSGGAPAVTDTPAPQGAVTVTESPVPLPTSTSAPGSVASPGASPTGGSVSPAPSTPLPTRTATPTAGPPFALEKKSQVCDATLGAPLLQVEVRDAAGHPVPGVQVNVTWEGGEDDFFTGLKPEIDAGYGDFSMTPGVAYTLRLGDGGQTVGDLASMDCSASDGSSFAGGWMLVFTQP